MPDKEKKHLEFVDKIILTRQEDSFLQRVEKADRILRVHFEVLQS